MTTLRALEKSPLLKAWPVIVRTLRTLSNVRVRNVATVGGHLAHGDPHMDLPPLLSALDATVTIAGQKGERGCPVEALYAGYLETTLAQGEIITRLTVPAMGARRAAYLKCTTRSADDWPALGVAVVLDGEKTNIVVSAATDKPTRLASADAAEGLHIESDCTAPPPTRSSCCAFIWPGRSMKRATQATETPQVGRSVPRLESWLKSPGRAEYVHNLRLPGMLYGKIFRSSVSHGRIKRIDVSAARALAGVHSVVTAAEVKTIVRIRTMGRHSTTSRFWLWTRCATSASRSRWCSPPTRMSRRRRCISSLPSTRSCPRSTTKWRR